MGTQQLSDDADQLEDDVEMAIKNIRWAKEAASAKNIQKANNHLHRAEELLDQHATVNC